MNRRAIIEVIYQAYTPGQADYAAEINELQEAGIRVLYIGGYHKKPHWSYVRHPTAATRFNRLRV